jgi:hypothetical protein
MAAIPNVYTDAGLTVNFDPASHTIEVSAINGSSGDGVLYFGTPTAGNKIEASSDPGVDPIQISIADSDELTGPDAEDIKLAVTSAGLDTAVGGAALSIGATVLGGSANAVPIYVRWTNGTGAGEYTDISLTITDRQETAV